MLREIIIPGLCYWSSKLYLISLFCYLVNFNLALLVGFIVGVFSSIFISNQIWLWLEEKRITRKPKEKKKKIDDDEPNEIKIKGVNC